MKMPISEIADRYSIALLKKERADANNTEEIITLYQELAQNPDTLEFVNKLKEVNGKIWDLESDIRKGKEGELGLEEVGRRAIAIRELNKIRVGYKNQMVLKYGEGFEDIKMNHASV
jgi:hypothetical protein